MNNISLGDRIKEYEAVYDYKIMRRCPILIRVDGCRFSKLTKKLIKPSYDFTNIMAATMKNVAADIEGCVFAYGQSDEITFILKNDQSIKSQPWHGNRVQKMISITSAFTTFWFNRIYNESVLATDNPIVKPVVFDARVFTVPDITEVINALIFRQRDAIRNSASMVVDKELAKKYSKKKAFAMLDGKKTKERLEIMKQECDIDFWTYYRPDFIKGSACYKIDSKKELPNGQTIIRPAWFLNSDIPKFSEDDSIIRTAYETKEEEIQEDTDI